MSFFWAYLIARAVLDVVHAIVWTITIPARAAVKIAQQRSGGGIVLLFFAGCAAILYSIGYWFVLFVMGATS